MMIPKNLMADLSKKALAGLVEGAAATIGTVLMKNMIMQQKSKSEVETKKNQGNKPDKKDFKEVE